MIPPQSSQQQHENNHNSNSNGNSGGTNSGENDNNNSNNDSNNLGRMLVSSNVSSMNSNSFRNTNENNTRLSGISVSSHYLTKQGVMQNLNLDNKRQGAAYAVEQGLRLESTPSATDSTKYHKLDRSLQGAPRQLENRQRRDTLTSALNARPDMQELLDAGYISEYGNKMADSLQPAVLALEETLVQNFSETQEY